MMEISSKDVDILRSEVNEAIRLGTLTDKQLQVIYDNKLFNMFVPEYLGGLGVSLIEALQVEEQLARIDGSLGWTVTMCAGANMFVGYLESFLAKMIFQDPKVCFGGSGQIDGIAKVSRDGYIVNGTWDYIVGLPHCTVLTLNCHIEEKGELLYKEDGSPYFKTFFFFPKEINVIEDWQSVGLKATASHSVNIRDFRVSSNRAFEIDSNHPVINEQTYHYPFMSFALLTLTANHLGMQEHFMDELRKYFTGELYNKYFEFKDELFYQYEEKFLERRAAFYRLAQSSSDEIALNGKLTEQTTADIEKMCKGLVYKGRNAVLKVIPYLGMGAMNYTTEMNRIIGDILTASQFSLLLPENLE
ncbi:hydroxylase [Myroides odoratimimus]|uniref:hydroxylase n=1 Tax=Myroides TaxID=76831 RepID=UPI00057DC642|nr:MULTISPECIES: hydroxylase [Myroides]AJA67823.1 Acyl-CoA dehydrogenase, N-terminal domain [Myroides sp. A21]MDM1498335.1 hydroxylase [Myroides odoratimimus]MDM1518568.1 hydroxylase [Myroides odoratimimus]MDM1530001.1 hydroxylase [Myroides odoratimimus]MDM1534654.1 hydroxylase [Myroides odoratimimus]